MTKQQLRAKLDELMLVLAEDRVPATLIHEQLLQNAGSHAGIIIVEAPKPADQPVAAAQGAPSFSEPPSAAQELEENFEDLQRAAVQAARTIVHYSASGCHASAATAGSQVRQ